jgi:hypothetical protein
MKDASRLTIETIRVLHLLGCYAWRQNNGAVYDAKIGKHRKNSSTPGISDILGYHKKSGKIVAVEIKFGKDTLSEEQEKFLQGVEKSGGYAFVVKSSDDIIQLKEKIQ